jgi:hypothetical protein
MADVWFSGLMVVLPQANAGPDQSTDEFDVVTLDGSASIDPKKGTLSFQWQQTAGTNVILSGEQSAQPTFTAPDVGPSGEILVFQLTVTDEIGAESIDTTSVNVHNPNSSNGGGGGGCFIATVTNGSRMESHGKVLWEFRDEFLLANSMCSFFVNLYYTYSPPVADFISRYNTLRTMVRWSLTPLVGLSWLALTLGPSAAILVLALVVVFLVMGSVFLISVKR